MKYKVGDKVLCAKSAGDVDHNFIGEVTRLKLRYEGYEGAIEVRNLSADFQRFNAVYPRDIIGLAEQPHA